MFRKRLNIKSEIKKCKYFSKKTKSNMLKLIIKEYSFKGFHLHKDLFYNMMEARIYDIYTSSILLLIQNNPISLNTLLRGQLENLGLLQFLLNDPEKIEDFFGGSLKVTYARELKKIRPELARAYGNTSDYVHPKMEGLKVIFTDVSAMAPKNPDKIESFIKNKKSFTEKEIRENFDLIPQIMKEGIPHNKIKKEDFEKIAEHLVSFYVACLVKLNELYEILPKKKVKNLGDLWKKYNKKK